MSAPAPAPTPDPAPCSASGPAAAPPRPARPVRPARVMHVTASTMVGGTERMLATMLPRFDPNRIVSRLVSYTPENAPTPVWREAGLDLVHLGLARKLSLGGARRMAAQIRAWKPDLVMTYGLRANLMTRVASWLAPVRAMVTGQRGIEDWKRRSEVWLESWSSPWVDLYIGNSQACCDMLARRERIPARKLLTIPNGLDFRPPDDLAAQAEALRAEHALPRDRTLVGAVGRLLPVKGHEHLIRAVRAIRERHSEVYVILVGQDHRDGALQALAEAEGVAEHIRFAGYSNQIAAWLSLFDCFVLPSLSEGMPVAALEAMFMEKPVVATAVGGTPEVVLDGRTGRLVPAEDPSALARAVIAMLDDPEEARRMAAAGRARAESEFRVETMIQRYESAFLDLLARKHWKGE